MTTNNKIYEIPYMNWEALNYFLDDSVENLVYKFEYEQWQLDILIGYLSRINRKVFVGSEDLERLYQLAIETKNQLNP